MVEGNLVFSTGVGTHFGKLVGDGAEARAFQVTAKYVPDRFRFLRFNHILLTVVAIAEDLLILDSDISAFIALSEPPLHIL